MTFNILTIQTADAKDSYFFPIHGEGDNIIEFEENDGQNIHKVEAHWLEVRQVSRRLVSFQKIRADVFMTDARVAVACEKYDKGGGWRPMGLAAIPVTVALNTASKAMAKNRRRGKILVGHVRYEWLHQVEFHAKSFLNDEKLRLTIVDNTNRMIVLIIHLPKNIDSGLLAQNLIQRAANFRLNKTENRPDSIDKLKELAQAARISPGDNGFGCYTMPTYYRVGDQPHNSVN